MGGLKKGGTDIQTDWQCKTVASTGRLTDKHTDRGHYSVFTLWVEGIAPHALAVWLYLVSRQVKASNQCALWLKQLYETVTHVQRAFIDDDEFHVLREQLARITCNQESPSWSSDNSCWLTIILIICLFVFYFLMNKETNGRVAEQLTNPPSYPHIHAHIHSHTHTHTHMHMHTNTHTHPLAHPLSLTHTNKLTHTHMNTHTCTHTLTYTLTYCWNVGLDYVFCACIHDLPSFGEYIFLVLYSFFLSSSHGQWIN